MVGIKAKLCTLGWVGKDTATLPIPFLATGTFAYHIPAMQTPPPPQFLE